MAIDPELVIPDSRRTIAGGAIKPFQTNFYSDCQDDLERFLKRAGLPEDVPYAELPEATKRLVWDGEPGGRQTWRKKWYGVDGLLRVARVAHLPHARARLPLALPQLSASATTAAARACGPRRRLFRLDGRTLPELEALPVAEAERALREWDGRSDGRPLDPASEQLLSRGPRRACASWWTSGSAT